jgi:negative regulator of flagellin synthesis FlgM
MKIGPSTEKPLATPAPATPAVSPQAEVSKTAAAASAAAAVTAKQVAPLPATVEDSAKIKLSSTASNLLAGGVGADFDAEKVARISSAISSGSFKIDPEAIADKLIANAQELLDRSKV